MPATKKHTSRSPKAAATKQQTTKPSSGLSASRTVEDNIGHLRMNVMCCVPGMLNTDTAFRRVIIRHLVIEHKRELAAALKGGK
jgi:hypothetical protein